MGAAKTMNKQQQNHCLSTDSGRGMGGSRGRWQEVRTPLKNHKSIGFRGNTGPDPLKNHKATKPAFNVGPSSARQRNADVGLLMLVFGLSLP